jgi:peptidoglycan glycosyltransferase
VNSPLRRVTVVVIVLFSLLFLNLNWVQFVQYDYYKNNPFNHRVTVEEYSRPRGSILAGSKTLAESVATKDEELKYQREYPEGDPYAHLTGFQALDVGDGGMEDAQNDILSGNDPRFFVERLSEMFTGEQVAGGNVILTIEPKLQEKAWELLNDSGSEVAAVAAVDPRNGQILAQVSTPSYDPNVLADHDSEKAQAAWNELNAEGSGNPMLDRATNDVFPPGSTMKIITAAVALENGMSPDTEVPAGNEYIPPGSENNPIRNSNDQCGEKKLTLQEALARSCNTTFAQLCVDDFDGAVDDGAAAFADMAQRFGFADALETPLNVAASQVGDVSEESFLARACFGQHEVRETPMQNALIAAAIANGGEQKAPHLIKEIQGPDKTTIEKVLDDTMAEPIDSGVAEDLRTMMENVVTDGTGSNAAIDGKTVGGKTGTAEHGTDESGNPLPEHGWFMGYAMDGNGDPAIAVSVLLTNAGEEGSANATAIAGELMKLAVQK